MPTWTGQKMQGLREGQDCIGGPMNDVKWGTERWREYIALADQLGRHLTGRHVSVVPGAPRMQYTKAEMLPTPAGALVTIREDISGEEWCAILLHELGHVRHHFIPQKSWALAERPAKSIPLAFDTTNEAEADAQRDRWAAWVEANMGRLERSLGDPILDRLAVLRMIQVYKR